ncbi:UDP-2,4-diacetamido-2,4,6-trideoxy-beta-L-altropyranose hydrolase [compost metagenome]
MKVIFRVDASLKMGTGHLMRCLTLADALRADGAQCHFITREHPGHLNSVVLQRGHGLSALPYNAKEPLSEPLAPAHADWLGDSWQNDAQQTATLLASLKPDWLVVDHYALEQRWERQVTEYCQRLLVIDDLADRNHCCNILLDQNLGSTPEDYIGKIPASCKLLLGTQFALLRPEFAELRDRSLARRNNRSISNLLISMGGVDAPNATGRVLAALHPIAEPDWRIQVVMGATAPWLSEVQSLVNDMPCTTQVLVNTSDMAQIMSGSDLAIGAAGATSWERCCLGVPSIMLILAENQRGIGIHLEQAGAASVIPSVDQITDQLPVQMERLRSPERLQQMALAAAAITDGQGTQRVKNALFQLDRY